MGCSSCDPFSWADPGSTQTPLAPSRVSCPWGSLLHHHFCHTPSLLPVHGPTLMLTLTEGSWRVPATSISPKPVAHLGAGAPLVSHAWGRGVGRKSRNLSAHVNPGAVGSGHRRLWERQGGGQGQQVQTPQPQGSSGGCSPQCWLISCLTKARISSSCRAHRGAKVAQSNGGWCN